MGKSLIKSRATERYSKARRRRKAIGWRQIWTGKKCAGGNDNNFRGDTVATRQGREFEQGKGRMAPTGKRRLLR